MESPGIHCALQDLGRPGNRAAGVPTGGAMDRFALVAANRLVGNPATGGVLECTLAGPALVALQACLVSVTGADFEPRVNGAEAPTWTSFWLSEGDRLTFGGRRSGARCYIGIAGGLAGDRWLGSVSTYQLVARGGLCGRPLRKGDELQAASAPARPAVSGRRLPERLRPAYSDQPVLDAVLGPHSGSLAAGSRRRFFAQDWTVSRDADRMGYRLEGEPLETAGPEMISFGLAPGCVQVPGSGQPILLMADSQTAGGYPVVAGVGRASLPLAAQLAPGNRLRFREVAVGEAQARWRLLAGGLEEIR